MEFHLNLWCQSIAVLTILSLVLIAKTTAVDSLDNEFEELSLLINAIRQHEIEQEGQTQDDLGCHLRDYIQPIDKSIILSSLEVLPCLGNVTVKACYGRCDSSEIADYKLPYKISNHPVCMYTGRTSRWVKLSQCHPSHPDPMVEVFDATGCACQKCDQGNTNCDHLNG